jgi:hypothetical protein
MVIGDFGYDRKGDVTRLGDLMYVWKTDASGKINCVEIDELRPPPLRADCATLFPRFTRATVGERPLYPISAASFPLSQDGGRHRNAEVAAAPSWALIDRPDRIHVRLARDCSSAHQRSRRRPNTAPKTVTAPIAILYQVATKSGESSVQCVA